MTRIVGIIAAIVLLGTFAACGDEDESGDDGGGSEDFATQADAICADLSQDFADVALEEGYEMDEQDAAERLELTLPIRQEALDRFAELQPPADQAEAFEAYISNRQEAIDLSEAQIARLKEENTKAVEANAPDVDAAFEAAQKEASDLGLANCASELPSDDADASEAVLREFLTTADPATSCNPDALVTETFIEEGLGGQEKCENVQGKIELPTDVKVSNATGVDDVVANLEFEEVGGKFDKVPSTSTLYYLDGEWKVYSINALE